jgi:eukaryotic-like serine/threonine-protein kinase
VKRRKVQRLKPGERIRPHITVVAPLDSKSPDPSYIAWNHREICPVACKLFASMAQARHEASIIASLTHPNIVRMLCLDGGKAKPACLVMEYLEGMTLRHFLGTQGGKKVNVSDSMRFAIHICAALRHMHGKGFLHLDVKPSNIIVTHGRPVLFDFGVARKKHEWRQKRFGGSDLYMPPEQIEGGSVSPASDIFGLGMTLFEMLTGELPFIKSSAKDKHPQMQSEPIRLRAFSKNAPAGLERLIIQCLAKDARQRPQTAAALAPQLHAFITKGPAMWPPFVDQR